MRPLRLVAGASVGRRLGDNQLESGRVQFSKWESAWPSGPLKERAHKGGGGAESGRQTREWHSKASSARQCQPSDLCAAQRVSSSTSFLIRNTLLVVGCAASILAALARSPARSLMAPPRAHLSPIGPWKAPTREKRRWRISFQSGHCAPSGCAECAQSEPLRVGRPSDRKAHNGGEFLQNCARHQLM